MKNYKSFLLTLLLLGVITFGITYFIKQPFFQKQVNLGSAFPSINQEEAVSTGQMGRPLIDTQTTETWDTDDQVINDYYAPAGEAGIDIVDRKVAPVAPDIMPYYPADDALEVDQRLYVKSSSHQVVVKDVALYLRQLKEYVLSVDGRVLSSNQGTTEKYQYGYLITKIPVEKFEEGTARVTSNVKKVISESINSQDETGRVVNLNDTLDELKNQKAEKEIELSEATTESQRKRIELEIQRLEKQIKNLEDQLQNQETQISYATIQVMAADSEAYFQPGNYQPDFEETLRNAWQSVSKILYFLAQAIIWVIVYAIIWLPVIVILKYLKNQLFKNKTSKK